MSNLGRAVLNAMREQGWFITFQGNIVTCIPPTGEVIVLTWDLLADDDEMRLRVILLALIAVHGLWWPWPPDHRPEVYGETPITE